MKWGGGGQAPHAAIYASLIFEVYRGKLSLFDLVSLPFADTSQFTVGIPSPDITVSKDGVSPFVMVVVILLTLFFQVNSVPVTV